MRFPVAPLPQLAQNRARLSAEFAGTGDAPDFVIVARALHRRLFQGTGARLAEPFDTPSFLQSGLELLRKRKEVTRIVHRVFRHVPRQWPLGPVRFLRTFHQRHAKILFHQRSEAERTDPDEPRGDHRVENPGRFKPEAAAEQSQIEVRALEHNLFRRERAGERREIHVGQRINQVIVPGNANLDQAKFFEITMETVGLGIDGDAVDVIQFRKQFLKVGVGLDHLNPLSSSSAFVFVAFKLSISFSIASIGGSAAMALRSNWTRSHSSG